MDVPAVPLIDHPALQGAAVTVVTVCRNPGPLLAGVVDSVAALERTDVVHVVIDGASTDGTVEYLRSESHRLACWRSEPDSGIYDAMNKGWAVAGPRSYVLFLGADDRLLALPSADELSAARARGDLLIYGDVVAHRTPFVSNFTAELRFRNTLHHQALLVSKLAHPAPPFDPRYRVYGDWDFNLRLWKQGARACYLSSLRSYASPGGVSSTRPLGEAFAIASKHAGLRAGLVVCYRVMKGKLRDLLQGKARYRRN
ncbi:hypothetical protein RA210_U200025 [Rubrivivax sp. A210]|uniref:glycosyltransferase family 2 protein n=1 Tax=Rubrivivax sp. A210 TaxID=2772301 RepID=UPI001917A7D0|nr:glycosyltransferase family 2 protein [Rubrivivax sp. A210]CAD5372638.1 hypothetical protein RA210_U200025 [Rubrivivax sp. A210]